MAPPTVKDTTTLKHTVKGDRPESASHGYHSGHHGEGKTEVLHSRDEHSRVTESNKLDVKDLRVTIIASRWYEKEIRLLVEACSEELLSKGVAANNLHLFEVSGAFELPYAAARMVHCKDTSHRPDAVICIGCIVKDATLMCGTMSKAVANGIMKLNVTSDVPVIYGVLCCESESQVHTCSIERVNSGNSGEKRTYGASWAQSALEMAHLKRCASAKKAEHCHCSRCTMRGGGPGGMRTSGKQESGNYDSCKRCGSPAEKCPCLDCHCLCCTNKRGECSSCGSSGKNCSCKDCKCKVCCENRVACRSCGCPADKCSCEECKCSSCCGKKRAGMKTPHCETTGTKILRSETAAKEEGSSSSSGVHGNSGKCSNCGSPGGKCVCGLLH